jgi:hypothetical protein
MTYAMPFQKYVKTVLRVAASWTPRAEKYGFSEKYTAHS